VIMHFVSRRFQILAATFVCGVVVVACGRHGTPGATWLEANDPRMTLKLDRATVFDGRSPARAATLRKTVRGLADYGAMEQVCTHAQGFAQRLESALAARGGARFDAGLKVQALVGHNAPESGTPIAITASNGVAAYVCTEDLDVSAYTGNAGDPDGDRRIANG
jgi:NADH:ubiquinone oxidoreductase subunit F (NADH-binding)